MAICAKPASHPTYPHVVSALALFVALGGQGYAAVTIINGRDIPRSVGPARKLVPNSLTSAQINENRLGASLESVIFPHQTTSQAIPPGQMAQIGVYCEKDEVEDALGGFLDVPERSAL